MEYKPYECRASSLCLWWLHRICSGIGMWPLSSVISWLYLSPCLLPQAEIPVNTYSFVKVLPDITKYNPWFPKVRTLNVENWDRVGRNLRWVNARWEQIAPRNPFNMEFGEIHILIFMCCNSYCICYFSSYKGKEKNIMNKVERLSWPTPLQFPESGGWSLLA